MTYPRTAQVDISEMAEKLRADPVAAKLSPAAIRTVLVTGSNIWMYQRSPSSDPTLEVIVRQMQWLCDTILIEEGLTDKRVRGELYRVADAIVLDAAEAAFAAAEAEKPADPFDIAKGAAVES